MTVLIPVSAIVFQKKLEGSTWQTLSDDSEVNGVKYAKGSRYKAFTTRNFGWIVFHPDTKTPQGTTPRRRYHKL